VALHRLVSKLGLEDRVIFYDHLPDPAFWLQGIDIFISNSYWEGHQVALVEAMASGCYCLCHFWDGAEEVVPSDQLYGTDMQLQELILEYAALSETERRDRQARMRAIAAERFDIEITKARIRDVIEAASVGW